MGIDLSMVTPLGQSTINVKGYPHNLTERSNSASGFVETTQHTDVLAKMMLTHTTGDFCLVGKKVRRRAMHLILCLVCNGNSLCFE